MDVIIAKKNLRADYDRTVCQLLNMKKEDIARIALDDDAPAIHRILARAIGELLNIADLVTVDRLLDRTLGKAVDSNEMILRDTAELTKQMLALSDEERIKLIEVRLKQLKDGVHE